ncbi:MAG TPA: oligosaccharide flippase family protein, partial [Bacteroidia bacterium]|nr:oligosaccharide flippase family protein [Bacteroidia bacterium]
MGIIQRQGIKNFITTYSGFIIGFINLMILQPRFLSPEELGLTRILYSFSMLLAMFVPMGIGNATTRYFPIFKDEKSRHHGYFGFMLLFILTGFLIASGLLFFSQEFFIQQYEKESPLFAQYFHFVFPFILILALISCLNIYSYALLKSTVPAFLNDVFTRLTIMALVTIYFLKWISLDQFIMLFVGVYLLQ